MALLRVSQGSHLNDSQSAILLKVISQVSSPSCSLTALTLNLYYSEVDPHLQSKEKCIMTKTNGTCLCLKTWEFCSQDIYYINVTKI